MSFNPRKYLETYYSMVDSENAALMRFWRDMPVSKDMDVLEIGCGPSLMTAITLATRAKELHLTDLRPECLFEIDAWIARSAVTFSWDAVIAYYAGISGSSVWEIENALRSKTSTEILDIRNPSKLEQFDLVVSTFGLEDVSDGLAFTQIVENFCALCKPDGTVAIAIVTGKTYTVSDTEFELPFTVGWQELISALISVGMSKFTFRTIPISNPRGYTDMLALYANR